MHCFGEISYSHDNVATTVDMHLTPAMKDGGGGGPGCSFPLKQHFTLNCIWSIYKQKIQIFFIFFLTFKKKF